MWSFSNTTTPPTHLREQLQRAHAEHERETQQREAKLKKDVVRKVTKGMYHASAQGVREYHVDYAQLKLDPMKKEGCYVFLSRFLHNAPIFDGHDNCYFLSKRYEACITSTINEEFVKKQGFEFKNGVIRW